MAAIGRSLISDSDWVLKIRDGDFDAVRIFSSADWDCPIAAWSRLLKDWPKGAKVCLNRALRRLKPPKLSSFERRPQSLPARISRLEHGFHPHDAPTGSTR